MDDGWSMGIVDVFAICSMCFAIFAYCSYLCALQKKKESDFIIRLFEYKDSETKWLCCCCCCCCCYVYCESEEFSVLGCLDGAREIRIGRVKSASNHHLGESVLYESRSLLSMWICRSFFSGSTSSISPHWGKMCVGC